MKVFVSYSSHDDVAVRSLAADLQRAHQQVWLDQALGSGDAWWAEILEQIRACTVFVFALSNNSLYSTLAAGSTSPTELPFSGLDRPLGVAVDTTGGVYVTDPRNNRVLKLAAGSSSPTELVPGRFHDPIGVAVDTAGNVYVTELAHVFKLSP